MYDDDGGDGVVVQVQHGDDDEALHDGDGVILHDDRGDGRDGELLPCRDDDHGGGHDAELKLYLCR